MPKQLELAAVLEHEQPPRWGGKRKGAGRKRMGPRENVKHRVRPLHHKAHPVHVMLRGRSGLPSFRQQRVSQMVRSVLHGQRTKRYAADFQVDELTIHDDHLHMVVEASAKGALRSGVSGLVIAFARRLNKMLGRTGKVWADRWRGRELASPREVRNALVHVFRNLAKHSRNRHGTADADPWSRAPRSQRLFAHELYRYPGPWPGPWPEAPPRTWLLGTGCSTKPASATNFYR